MDLGLASPEMNLSASPNPSDGINIIRYSVDIPSQIKIIVYDMQGKQISLLADKKHEAGVYTLQWNNTGLAKGTYVISAVKNGIAKQAIKVVKN